MQGRQWPAAHLHCAGGKGRPQEPSNAAGALLAALHNIAALEVLPLGCSMFICALQKEAHDMLASGQHTEPCCCVRVSVLLVLLDYTDWYWPTLVKTAAAT